MDDADARLARIEARLRDLEDREEIREVVARYGFTADLGIDEAYVAQYTEDGEYDTGTAVFRGHEQLREFISAPEGTHKSQVESRGSQHTSHNLYIRVQGATAWAECYSVVFVRVDAGSFGIRTAAYNHWDFRRVEGRWRIVRRRRTPIGEAVHRTDGVPGIDVMTDFVEAPRPLRYGAAGCQADRGHGEPA
ncbi:MAG TPA: nuclear transport factor 2 family protein [Amycolatopsis sp.]|nr:nuclear transport factor 2 family protein [Amycolatopsis sp.]